MRRRRIPMIAATGTLLIALVFASLALPSVALAVDSPNTPSSGKLVEQPKRWDGRRVRFEGEVIGEAMVRGDMAWIHINDDGYYLKNVEEGSGLHGYNSGMPVWVASDLAKDVKVFGDYKHEGEIVEIVGTFNAACREHGGDMDIHAESLELVRAGHPVVEQVKGWKIVLAAGLSLLALILWWARRVSGLTLDRGAVTRRRA